MTTHAQIIYKETGLTESANPHEYSEVVEACRQFAVLAVEAEREACAQVCEARYMGDNNREDMEAKRCASAIRARSK